ncbi:MAG TPA: Fic family protein [Acidocella sp.]|jgi:Fic family protein|uniref:Fic family protein n=1 Tax=Acidocella sp. TaxID=50710 RepID=UPI002B73C5F2|nr:Fic family protein [Acidocella sp.]HVE21578.1 Fic family protein [Acidocella sp.]
MLDSNWDSLNGPVAHEIEALNYSNQVNVIEALIKVVITQVGLVGTRSAYAPNVNALKELHRTATIFLLHSPGEFRMEDVRVVNGLGEVRYQAPPFADVPALVDEFCVTLQANWLTWTQTEVSAFALWKINWIHPFKNGNGRTARAFAYACLCLQFGGSLPGSKTVIDLIMTNQSHRDAYEAALSHADGVFAQNKTIDVSQLSALIEQLLREQLLSAMPSPP